MFVYFLIHMFNITGMKVKKHLLLHFLYELLNFVVNIGDRIPEH
jgi:hypothetical protein